MRAWLVTFFFTLLVLLCVAQFAHARDGYGDRPLVCNPADLPSAKRLKACQDWIANVLRPDTGTVCCAEADAYVTDEEYLDPKTGQFYAVTTVEYSGVKIGTRIPIPNSKIVNARLNGGNPSGHSITWATMGYDADPKTPLFYVFCWVGGTRV